LALSIIHRLIGDQLGGGQAGPPYSAFYSASALSFAWAMIFAWLAFTSRERLRWRLVYASLAFMRLLIGVSYLIGMTLGFQMNSLDIMEFIDLVVFRFSLVLSIFIGIIAAMDAFGPNRWRWTHWCGIGLWFARMLSFVLGYLLFRM
jgi:hypothetical protein